MVSITAVLGPHEFGLCISLVTQGCCQFSTGRENFADGSAVVLTLGGSLETELCDFQEENTTLNGDYLRKVVAIVIGGVPTVL
jgi:hypothetical protein